jgi:hypothetical protein
VDLASGAHIIISRRRDKNSTFGKLNPVNAFAPTDYRRDQISSVKMVLDWDPCRSGLKGNPAFMFDGSVGSHPRGTYGTPRTRASEMVSVAIKFVLHLMNDLNGSRACSLLLAGIYLMASLSSRTRRPFQECFLRMGFWERVRNYSLAIRFLARGFAFLLPPTESSPGANGIRYRWCVYDRLPSVPFSLQSLAIAITLLCTRGHALLTAVVENGDYRMLLAKGVSPAICAVTVVALFLIGLCESVQCSICGSWS